MKCACSILQALLYFSTLSHERHDYKKKVIEHKILYLFYICSSVHRSSRLKKSNKMQQYANIYLLLNYSTCFGRLLRPSSAVHKTVTTASGTNHTISDVSFLKAWSRLKKKVE